MFTILSRYSSDILQCVDHSKHNIFRVSYMSRFSKYIPNFISKKRKPNIAVINLVGLIQPNMQGRQFGASKKLNLETLNKSIEKAFSLKKLKEVCLLVNSPGGSPVQSELIANKIIKLGREKNINVVSFVEDWAASGGYWLACAGKEIYIAENSIVGSIGVIYHSFGLHELIKQYGIERRIYSAGNSKTMLDAFSPEKEKDVELLKTMLNSIHQNFINYVKEQRDTRLNAEDDTLFNGEIWVGKQAVKLGLVDGINNLDDYVNQKYGNDVNIVRVNSQKSSGLSALFNAQYPVIDDIVMQQKYKFL